MSSFEKNRLKTIIDLEKLNSLNEEGCEPVVLACGAWEGKPKYIHENEAIFDEATSTYFERRCYASRKG
jgi:hypothetical protein